MIEAILDFFYRSDYAPMLVFGVFGLNCLIFAWLRYLWWQRVQRMAHTLAMIVVFVFLGIACISGGLATSGRAVRDFSFLTPIAQVAWILMQIALLAATVLLAMKLVSVARKKKAALEMTRQNSWLRTPWRG